MTFEEFNQFNLTTKRYTQSDIEEVAADPKHITLYGKLGDKFGDNGVVSIVIGRIDGINSDELHMELFMTICTWILPAELCPSGCAQTSA